MSKPTILAVDDDPNVSAAITRDLRGRYATGYRIVRATSGPEALEVLARLALRGQPVALIVADQRMPQMTGIEMLEQARTHAPGAKYLLLTAYADTDVAIKAINDIGLDYYLLKPWDPPEERLFPVIDDLLGDWRQANPDHTSDVQVVGHRWSDRSHDIKMFLARNYVPYRWYDVERDAEAQRLRDLAHATPADLPLVLVPDGDTLRSPSTLELAGALGLRTTARQPLYDVCIVGGGPAGLAAAVYAASEGLSTVIVEREAPGGQAGQSAAIENYLGFPKGLTGSDLAQRAIAQVSRFGAEVVLARDVVGFEARGPVRAVLFAGSGQIEARALIAATGVSYRAWKQPGSTSSPAAASTTARTPATRALRSALLPHLVRRAGPGPAGRPAAASGAVHPLDAGDQPVQALRGVTRFSVAAGFYRTCVIDGVLEYSPAEHVRRPAVPAESPTLGFTHLQFEALLTAARESAN
jgi:thioredoxin reductase (NADPH)